MERLIRLRRFIGSGRNEIPTLEFESCIPDHSEGLVEGAPFRSTIEDEDEDEWKDLGGSVSLTAVELTIFLRIFLSS